jgi:peptidoglycan/LPS O-acetylase OafA/YrhL
MAFSLPDWMDREVICFVVAAILITVGTLVSGLVPPTLPFQLLVGAVILGAFVLIVVCLRDEPGGLDDDR